MRRPTHRFLVAGGFDLDDPLYLYSASPRSRGGGSSRLRPASLGSRFHMPPGQADSLSGSVAGRGMVKGPQDRESWMKERAAGAQDGSLVWPSGRDVLPYASGYIEGRVPCGKLLIVAALRLSERPKPTQASSYVEFLKS